MGKKNWKAELTKILSLQLCEGYVNAMRRKPQTVIKYLQKTLSDKGLLQKIHKELLKLNEKTHLIKNRPKTLKDTSSKKTYK